MSTHPDQKYICFNRREFDSWLDETDARGLPDEIPDSVVIRTKDVFAGPALHSYAAAISIVVALIRDVNRLPHTAADLQVVADYFHTRALEADEVAASADWRLPT